ncbi:MAG TPA: efflux RND transporter permease subunit [Thermoanaerobaculia bacterium]|jgi:ABC-type multidrug transport system ATPase subunit|nr:efflux RND transporter permease subunit [Thermoanaerobaculia bacterium]
MHGRPLAHLIVTLALLVLGGFALARLPLDYLPRHSFPELTVGLRLGEERDPGEVAREWIEPVESAARSLGQVREVAGEVRTDGAELTVRFTPGVDPERKAARLDSELAHVRAGLPAGSSLTVDPAADPQGDLHAIVWLSGARDDAGVRAAAEALRGVPGVREVEPFGPRDEEVRIELAASTLDPWSAAGTVLAEARRSLRVPTLGWNRQGDHRRPVLVAAAGGGLAGLAVPMGGGAVPLGSLATLHARSQPPRVALRFRGAPARALFVWRSHDAAPLALDRALRRRLGRLPAGVRGEVGWSEAAPLRELAFRLALAALLTSLLGAAAGAWLAGRWGALSLGLAIPAATAAAANAFLLAGVDLNVATLIALTVAAISLLPLAALRLTRRPGAHAWGWTAFAAAAVLPVAVSLASAELGPRLAEPALALLLAAGAGVLAVMVLPSPRQPRVTALQSPAAHRLLKTALRDPGTVVLIAATAVYLSLTLFGGALLPRPGDLRPDQGNLTATLRLPQGVTLDETVRRAAKLEEILGKAEEVERYWIYAVPGTAQATAELRPAGRSPEARRLLATRLQYEAAGLGALEVASGLRSSASRSGSFLDDLEEHARTDDEATTYRMILRGADLAGVRAGYDRLLERLASLKVRQYWISGWDAPTVHLVLRPREGTSRDDAAAMAARLRLASLPPPALQLPALFPGGPARSLTVVPAGAPADADQAVPQLADLLARPVLAGGRALSPAATFALTQEAVHPRVARQSGRFVVPVEISILLSGLDVRKDKRKEIDRSLRQLALPAACDLELPSLRSEIWRADLWRLIGLGIAVPLLLFALAAGRLGSLARGLAALAPLVLGLVAALPLVAARLERIDELTLLALAGALALALPSAAAAAAAPIAPGGRLYGSLLRQAPWLLGAALALAIGLAAPTLGLPPGAAAWAVPLRAAAVGEGAALAASALLVPALLLIGRRWRERDPERDRQRRRPPAWSAPGEPTLEVRSLTKIYGGTFTASSGVSFTLTPGIVGLLGPNGAGKTTLLRVLTGLLEPTRGKILYRGVAITPDNLAEYRRRIGFLPQEFNAYPGFTAEQFLDHWAMERGLADPRQRRAEIERLLAAVGLAEHAGRKVRDFSGGMRQRVGIARALLAAPPILIVDEPTTGLDVESRGRFRQILLEQAAERVVVFSTHIASDIEAAASRILLLHRGKLRFDGPPEELTGRARGRVFGALVPDAGLLDFGRRYRVTSRVRVLEGIRVRAIARPDEPLAGDLVEPNLEEAYLAEIDRADG